MTPAELERLSILSEELGEVQQIIGKILRFGYESFSPLDKDKITNREHLERELGDVKWICDCMIRNNDINKDKIENSISLKEIRIKKYLRYNK